MPSVHRHLPLLKQKPWLIVLVGAPRVEMKKTKERHERSVKMAKRGSSPSQIGVILRDQYGIPQVKGVTGSKILRLLKVAGAAPDLPEDLYHLIKKAVNVRKHIEKYRADKDGKFRLILIESRIHRLARYYRTAKALAPTWRYQSKKADTLIA